LNSNDSSVKQQNWRSYVDKEKYPYDEENDYVFALQEVHRTATCWRVAP